MLRLTKLEISFQEIAKQHYSTLHGRHMEFTKFASQAGNDGKSGEIWR